MKLLLTLLITLMSCQSSRVIIVQDYKKVGDRWIKSGQPYAMPDTVKLIHAFNWIKSEKLYPY